MNHARRLSKLEGNLTPRQLVYRIFDRFHKEGSLLRFVMSHRDQDRRPFSILAKDFNAWIGQQRRMTTMKRWDGVSEMYFLMKVFLDVNAEIGIPAYFMVLQSLALSGLFESVRARCLASINRAGFEDIAAPLEQDTGAAIEAELAHYVLSPAEIIRVLHRWVSESFAGKRSRSAFSKRARSTVYRVDELVRSGALQPGSAVELAESPFLALRHVSLVDGEWIDAHLLELAEFGALIAERGWTFQYFGDTHPLAFPCVADLRAMRPVPAKQVAAVRNEAKKHLTNFPGKTRVIADRTYFSIADFRDWPERKVKGPLAVEWGIELASWNALTAEPPTENAPHDVPLRTLSAPLSEADFVVCSDSQEVERRRTSRAMMVELSGVSNASPSKSEMQLIRRLVVELAESSLAWRHVAAEISRRHFGSRPVLFAAELELLDTMIEIHQGLLAQFNELVGIAASAGAELRIAQIRLASVEARVRTRVGEDVAAFETEAKRQVGIWFPKPGTEQPSNFKEPSDWSKLAAVIRSLPTGGPDAAGQRRSLRRARSQDQPTRSDSHGNSSSNRSE